MGLFSVAYTMSFVVSSVHSSGPLPGGGGGGGGRIGSIIVGGSVVPPFPLFPLFGCLSSLVLFASLGVLLGVSLCVLSL